MKALFKCRYFQSCRHFMVVIVLMNACVYVDMNPVNGETTLSMTVIDKPTTTVASVQSASQLATDYDYHDFGKHIGFIKPKTRGGSTGGVTGNPQNVETPRPERLPSVGNLETSPTGMGGLLGERFEWLRERVWILHRHGRKDQIDALQKDNPQVNLTLLYDFYNQGGAIYEKDGSPYYHNGTYHWRRTHDMDDGYWYNITFYPGMKGPSDGALYNGTLYTGDQDMEDSYFYNGTYYPDEEEMQETQGGNYINDTYYAGNEDTGYGQEETDEEDLMWWQLHHPRWRDVGANSENKQPQVPPKHIQQQLLLNRKWDGHPPAPATIHHHQQRPQLQQPPQQRPGGPQASPKIPMGQQRPPQNRPIPMAVPRTQNQPPQFLPQGNAPGSAPQNHQGVASKSGLPPTGNANTGPNTGSPGKAHLMGSEPQKEHIHPPAANNISAAMSWGIVLAAIFGISIVAAPFLCLLYKYRQSKRIKKRTLLRRPDHGSVDDGIMDAMVMRELGEKKNSRVKLINEAGKGRQKPEKRRDKANKMGLPSKSMSRVSYEVQAPTTSRTFVNIHDEPNIIV